MRGIFHLSYLMGALLIIGETLRRGFAYWGVYATTIIEDSIGRKRSLVGLLQAISSQDAIK